MSWSFEEEKTRLYNKLLESNEDISIADFYKKYASKEFLDASAKEHKRLEELHKKGIWE